MVKFAQMPRYEAYKDSGVEWLGEVPVHWNVYPLCFKTHLKSISNTQNEELLSVYLDKGVIRFDEVGAKRTNVTSQDLSKYQLVEPGDFVLNNQQAWRGSVGVSEYRGIVSPAYLVLSLSDDINAKYANYLFRDSSMVSHYLVNSRGVGTIQRNLYWQQLKRAPIFLPTLEEQDLIAKFLDQKTAQIDAAIAIKEQQIELLKERKQIIIQQAVTQGLDSNVPMKNSGVEWIGQIPEHWELQKLKHGLVLTNDKIESKKSQLKYLGMESVQAATGLLSGVESEADGLANIFHSGQVLFGKLRPYLAKVYLAEFDGVCSTEFLVFDVKANYDRGYVSKLLLSDGFIKTVDASTYGSKMPRANPNFILNILLPTPPIIEQLQIYEYINNVSSATESAIINTVKQIQKLKEYKTTLINSAVTGKIKVTPEMLQA